MSSAAMRVSFRGPMQPWAAVSDDDARFWRISLRILGVALVVCLVMPWLPVVKPEPPAPPAPSVPIAKMLLPDKPPVAIPLPVLPPQVKAPVATATPEPVRPEVRRPEPVKPPPVYKPVLTAEAIAAAKTPVPNQAPGESTEGARKKAASTGLFAGSEDSGALRAKVTAVQMNTEIKQGPGVGTGVGKGVGAGVEDGTPERAMITSNAATGSGGITTAAFSRNTGGAGLGGRNTTLVAGGFDNGVDGGTGTGRGGTGTGSGRGNGNGPGGLGGEGNGTGTGTGRGGTLNKGGGGRASRSIEEIRVVFDRNKGAIYAIYNRALRDEPALQGKVVLKLTIAPSGALVDCRIESTELHAAELEAKLLARIRQFDFGAKDVDQMTVTWPVDFLPS